MFIIIYRKIVKAQTAKAECVFTRAHTNIYKQTPLKHDYNLATIKMHRA